MKIFFAGICLLSLTWSTNCFGQNEIDALRYSIQNLNGTARFNGMSGAFGAIGADLSVSSINPAGMAKFNKSELAFSTGGNIYGTEAAYNGTSALNQGGRPSVNQVGFVAVHKFEDDSFNLWKTFQFGINYNKLNIFNQKSSISGLNTNSMLAVFAQQAYGIDSNDIADILPFGSGLAYSAFGIDPDKNGGLSYTHPFQNVDSILQNHIITRKGGMHETTFSFSGNYNDKLLLGGSIGITRVNFTESTEHSESVYYDTSGSHLENFDYDFNLITTGRGINAKIGVILLPTSFLRIGLAAHSPTRIALTDTWESNMSSYFVNIRVEAAASPTELYQYAIITPAKFVLSGAGIIAKKAVISADIEYIDYANARLKDRQVGSYDFQSENAAIQRIYSDAFNIRVGSEVRLSQFFLRAGGAYHGSPYEKDSSSITNSADRRTFSLGFGYRNKHFFADISVMHTWWKEDYYLYDPVLVNPATLSNSITNIGITAGLRF